MIRWGKTKSTGLLQPGAANRARGGDRSGEARTLHNIGLVYDSVGEKQRALDYYNQALPIERAVGNRSLEATTLTILAGLMIRWGKSKKHWITTIRRCQLRARSATAR